jgi:molecular chaperone DnaJ
VTVPTLAGDEELEIPPGTQPGTIFTLRRKGMPALGRSPQGDQRVVVNVVIPTNLSQRQRDLLEGFQETLGEQNLAEPEPRSVFERVRRALG